MTKREFGAREVRLSRMGLGRVWGDRDGMQLSDKRGK